MLLAMPLAAPLRAFADNSSDPCSPPTALPDSPFPPLMLVAGAAVGLALLVYVRRRRGIGAAAASTLTLVVLAGAVVGCMLAGACPQGGGVQGISTSSPLTGADIPWITAVVLIAIGTVATVTALVRRRRSA